MAFLFLIIQPIRPLAELEEHCPVVVFYWRLVLLMCLSSCAVKREKAEQKGCCAWAWLSSTVPSSQTTIFTLFIKPYKLGAHCVGEKSLFLFRQEVLFQEFFCFIPITCSSPAFVHVFPGSWIAAHTLFHGALAVAGTLTPRQNLCLK